MTFQEALSQIITERDKYNRAYEGAIHRHCMESATLETASITMQGYIRETLENIEKDIDFWGANCATLDGVIRLLNKVKD